MPKRPWASQLKIFKKILTQMHHLPPPHLAQVVPSAHPQVSNARSALSIIVRQY